MNHAVTAVVVITCTLGGSQHPTEIGGAPPSKRL